MKSLSKKLASVLVGVSIVSLVLSGCGTKKAEPAAATPAAVPKINYPEKAITIIVPWAAGGGTDLIYRKLADVMSKDLGKPIVVQNVNGGGGQVGFQQIASAKPDGYTVGATTISMLLQKLTQNTALGADSLTSISMINEDPGTLTVSADSPFSNVKDFVTAAQKDPEKLRVGNSGAKGVWHVAAMLIEKQAGIKLNHVPYEGANPAAVAVAGKHIEATTCSPGEVKPLVDSNKIKILAVMSDKRHPLYPNVPTFKESGYDLSFGVWRALVGPKGIPQEIVDKLDASVKKAVESDDFKKFMSDNGFGIKYMNSKDTNKFMVDQEKEIEGILK